jgi:ribosomal protein L40E
MAEAIIHDRGVPMAKNKCPQCGLVNWVDAEVCKRCKSSLLQTNETHDGAAEVGPTEQGALLSVCGICGTANDLKTRNITRTHTPNWVWLFLPLGALPAGILGLLLQVKHNFSLPLCRKCMSRHGLAGLVSWGSIVVCVFIFFIAVAVAMETKSWLAFLGVMAIAAIIAAFAGWFDKKANPRYVAFTKKRVEIDVPGKGRVVVIEKRSQATV